MSNSRTTKDQIIGILNTYIEGRQKGETYSGKLFGWFGYSKDKKIAAAKALRDFLILPNTTSNEASRIWEAADDMYQHLGALRQGTLSSIWTIFKSFSPLEYEKIKFCENARNRQPVCPGSDPYTGDDDMAHCNGRYNDGLYGGPK